jgi:hypothetical protein
VYFFDVVLSDVLTATYIATYEENMQKSSQVAYDAYEFYEDFASLELYLEIHHHKKIKKQKIKIQDYKESILDRTVYGGSEVGTTLTNDNILAGARAYL